MQETTPQEAYGFTKTKWVKPAKDRIQADNQALLSSFQQAQLDDLKSRKRTRQIVAAVVGLLLILQNGAIFWLIKGSFKFGTLPKLQWFFGVLMAATLAETYKLVELVMKWLFTDKPYKPDHGS